jgi:heme oxygenase
MTKPNKRTLAALEALLAQDMRRLNETFARAALADLGEAIADDDGQPDEADVNLAEGFAKRGFGL